MGIGWDDFDAFGFDRSVHERLDPLIEVGDETES
jgi:hypothetical protein